MKISRRESLLQGEAHASESKPTLKDIVDVPQIQSMMDDFYFLTGIGVAIVDIEGNVLVSNGWQDICTKFHRIHPETNRNCIESDIELSKGVEKGDFKLYKCKNNLWDVATPIMVDGEHLGNVFCGQFFSVSEQLDYDYFRKQAKRYGFDEEEYLEALENVPRFDQGTISTVMNFYSKLANLISELGCYSLKQQEMIDHHVRLLQELRESEQKLSATKEELSENRRQLALAMDAAEHAYWHWDLNSNETYFSPRYYRMLGYEPGEFPANFQSWLDLMHPDDRSRVVPPIKKAVKNAEPFEEEFRLKSKNGDWVWISGRGKSYELDKRGIPHRIVGVHVDITERKRANKALRFYLGLHEIVAEVSSIMMNARSDEIDEAVHMTLEKIGRYYGLDRGYIFLYSEGNLVMDNIHEWCAKGVQPQKDRIQNFPVKEHRWLHKQIINNKPVLIDDVDSLPARAETEKQEFKVQNIKSLVSFPLVLEGHVIGMMGFDSVHSYKRWDDKQMKLLGVVAKIISGAIKRSLNAKASG